MAKYERRLEALKEDTEALLARVQDDGGPAFPKPAHYVKTEEYDSYGHDGMSLRAYFAGQALRHAFTGGEDNHADEIAGWAVDIADALLAKLKE